MICLLNEVHEKTEDHRSGNIEKAPVSMQRSTETNVPSFPSNQEHSNQLTETTKQHYSERPVENFTVVPEWSSSYRKENQSNKYHKEARDQELVRFSDYVDKRLTNFKTSQLENNHKHPQAFEYLTSVSEEPKYSGIIPKTFESVPYQYDNFRNLFLLFCVFLTARLCDV